MTRLGAWYEALQSRQMPARHLCLFRALVGVLGVGYFASLIGETPEFSASTGLIDHELSFRLFWFTRLGLFHGALSAQFFYAVFGGACLLCLALTLGHRTRLLACVLYLVAVSTYRWNFLVIYVDDVIMHLLFFWLLLLPKAPTLSLSGLLRHPVGVWHALGQEQVRAFPVLCCLLNVAAAYWVAGATKWLSPMWREGTALYAVLKLPIARFPDFWHGSQLPTLALLNYAAMVTEVLIPILLLQRRSQLGFWFGSLLQGSFHLGIIALIGIPFANLGLLASVVLFAGYRRSSVVTTPPPPETWRERLSVAYLFVLSCACLYRVKPLWPLVQAAYATLWLGGLAQNYHLFDWIDMRNYAVRDQLRVSDADQTRELDPRPLMPRSPRHVLLRMNLYGMAWLPQAAPGLAGLRAQLTHGIQQRMLDRYCRREPPSRGKVCATSRVSRISRDNLDAQQGYVQTLMCFECDSLELARADVP